MKVSETMLTTDTDVALVLALDDATAQQPAVAGSKAACIAIAGAHGIPVVRGFVVTTGAHRRYLGGGGEVPDSLAASLRPFWRRLTREGTDPLVVRSSSTVEDIGVSSMAGRFRTVLDVRGWQAFLDAVAAVFDSAGEVGPSTSPMGVLVQPYVVPRRGGVMFGVDPVTGDDTRIVVEAVTGGPDQLVSGRVTAQHYVLTRHGRLRSLDHHPAHHLRPNHATARLLSTAELRALARLATRAEQVFGEPQDVEWAFDADGRILMLQSRPVTATGSAARAVGPVLGPGPIAETFPDPLGPLEVELWIIPLREAIAQAMTATRAVSAAHLADSPIVTTVGGRVAADLELFGYVPTRSRLRWLDPRPGARQLAAAWRVGEMRARLPERIAALLSRVDDTLSAIRLDVAEPGELLALLDLAVDLLRDLHHGEVLAGTLLPRSRGTAAGMALQVLAAGRAAGHEDSRILAEHPIVLSLTTPSLALPLELPPTPLRTTTAPVSSLGERELLRLRIRWVHELTVRVCWELGRRLAAEGLIRDPRTLGQLTRAELRRVVEGTMPVLVSHEVRVGELVAAFSPPLPAHFRLSDDGEVVPVARPGARPGGGVPAGGGRGIGPACAGTPGRPPSPGDVLVVRDLEPALAAFLPGLAGLVAETGSTLSHLAILAREYGVPTVVAVHDALHRFPAGTRLLVDGGTGEVRPVAGADEQHDAEVRP
jgi:rifampicin phosphotransferase